MTANYIALALTPASALSGYV